MTAYYNDFDKKTAEWTRQLIKNGDIAPGIVDDRSILDVTASDLKGFDQHHFFCGIGGWSAALRMAGWDDERQICTASLPCFGAGTAITTDIGPTPIERVRIGDMVLTHTGKYKRVLSCMTKIASTVIIKGFGSSGITTTNEHPFYSKINVDSEPSWTDAKDMVGKYWARPLQLVDAECINGSFEDALHSWRMVTSVDSTGRTLERVYNLEVEDDNSYVAGGIVVHNCQPFSTAGKQAGKDDSRHLLPHFMELVAQCNFPVIMGEQVEAAINHGWSDDLSTEMGILGYETAMQIIPVAALGGFHIRSRLWWVANKINNGLK